MNNKQNLKNILRSAFTLLLSDALAVIFLTIFSIALGRWLGAKIFGEYSLAITLSFILRTLSDAGYDLKIPRLIAKNPSTIPNAIVEAQYVKIRLWLIFFTPTIIAGLTLMNKPDFIVMLIWVIPCIYANTFRSVLRGIQQMKYIAIVESLNNFLLTLFLFMVLFLFPKLYMIFIGHLIIEIIKVIHYINILNNKFTLSLKPLKILDSLSVKNFNLLIIKNEDLSNANNQTQRLSEIVKEQFSLTAVTILDIIQMRIPAILLGWLTSLYTVGIFTASQRFITVLRIIPGAVFSTLLPNFSTDNDKKALFTPLILAFLVGVIITISINLLSGILITYTFAFEKSIIVLKILSWSFIFLMMNHVLQAFILSHNMEKQNNIFLCTSIITIIITSIYIYPKYGASGAAYSVIASEFLIFILYLILLLKISLKQK